MYSEPIHDTLPRSTNVSSSEGRIKFSSASGVKRKKRKSLFGILGKLNN